MFRSWNKKGHLGGHALDASFDGEGILFRRRLSQGLLSVLSYVGYRPENQPKSAVAFAWLVEG